MSGTATAESLRYRVTGMDCSSCAEKIQSAVAGLPGVESARVSIASSVMTLTVDDAAPVLIPHRAGDANMRAVWLFSRNDALGNLAVVVAAGLVFWTRSAWPDLVVAVIIAGLFLQSAWSIVRHARADLREARTPQAA